MSAATVNDELPIYIILGHGIETLVDFEERDTLPDGDFTLVTLAEAGTVTNIDQVAKILHVFNDEGSKEMLGDPLKHKKEIKRAIENKIHIYKNVEGKQMKIPKLKVSPLAYWTIINYKHKNGVRATKAVLSGVHRFPLHAEHIPDDKLIEQSMDPSLNKEQLAEIDRFYIEHLKLSNPFLKYYKDILTDDNLDEIYKDSVYPKAEDVKNIKVKTPTCLAYKFEISLSDLMKRVGPGIYYYVICRAEDNIMRSTFITYGTAFTSMETLMEEFELSEEDAKKYKKEMDDLIDAVYAERDYYKKTKIFIDGFLGLSFPFRKLIFEAADGGTYDDSKYDTKFKDLREYIAKTEVTRQRSVMQQKSLKAKIKFTLKNGNKSARKSRKHRRN